jgi:RHS repeat-associated protein
VDNRQFLLIQIAELALYKIGALDFLLKPADQLQIEAPMGPLQRLPLSPSEPNYRHPLPVSPGSVPPGFTTRPVENPDIQCGSVIQVDSLSLGEVIPINGLPLNLVYFSDRVPGRLGDYQIHIPLKNLLPEGAEMLNLSISGRRSQIKADSNKLDSFEFLWDGLDSHGSYPIGKTLAQISIAKKTGATTTLEPRWSQFIGNFKPRYLELGGWGISNLHYYSKDENIIYLGDGGVQEGPKGNDLRVASKDGSVIYSFNSKGRHMSTEHSLTGDILFLFNYDSLGRIYEIMDRTGRSTLISRKDNRIEIAAPYGQKTYLVVGSDGYLSSVSNEAQESYQMKYQASGLLTEFQKPQGQVSQFAYNNLGYLERDMGAGGSLLSFPGQISGTDEKIVNLQSQTALGRTASYTLSRISDGSYQRGKTEPDGRFSSLKYKSGDFQEFQTNDLQTEVKFSNAIERFGVKLNLPVSRRTVIKSLSQFPQETIISYEKVRDGSGSKESQVLTTKATTNGKITTSTFDEATFKEVISSPMGRQLTLERDSFGNILSQKIGSLIPSTVEYNRDGQMSRTGRGNRQVTFKYNKRGYLDSVTDPLSRETRFSYDKSGRVKKQVQSDGRVIEYNHDRNGNLIAITPPGRPAHQFSLNPFELIESYLAPLIGDQGPTNTQYFYNKDKQLTEILDPSGDKLEFVYGSADGRLDRISTPQGFYGFSYNQGSQIEQIVSPYDVTNRFSYYGPLPKSQSFSLPGSEENGLEFGYNKDLRVKSLKIQSGSKGGSDQTSSEITYNYDDDGFLTQAGEATIGLDPATGSVVSSQLGKVKETYGYDQEYGELKMMALSFNEQDLYQENLTRDDLGRITNKKVIPVGKKPFEFAYSYNPAGQLSSVHKDNELVSKYEYDFNGNPILKIKGGKELTSSYDSQDRLISDSMREYSYNPRGQLRLVTDKSGGSNGPNAKNAPNVPYSRQTQFNYDLVGNLVSVTLPDGKVIDYLTDGLNRRVAKKINGQFTEQYLYQSQLQIAALLDSEGRLVSRFVYGTKANVPDYLIKADRTYKIFSDHLGSPKLVIDTETGAVAQQIEYDEFGAVLSDSNPGFQPFGFAGGLYDSDTKLVRFGARDYNPTVGRWTSKDPILFAGGDTNLYGYVINDPINFIDPDGEHPVLVGAAIGVFFGAFLTPTPTDTPTSPIGEGARVLGGAAAGAAMGASVGMFATGYEFTFAGMRFAPFGNRTNNPVGQLPHYHRRSIDPKTGQTIPGQGIGRHRPWEVKSPDKNFCDRF